MADVKQISIDDFDYALPQERVAIHPLKERDKCKLLVWDKKNPIAGYRFSDLPGLLPDDAILVYNNTRVINARLRMEKPTGGQVEIFCLEPVSPADYAQNFASQGSCTWKCLVGNSKRWKQGMVEAKTTGLRAERIENDGQTSIIRFSWPGDRSFSEIIEAEGEIPIPPYLNRDTEPDDSQDYQTIYSRIQGSVAAPTAGLHFTDKVLEEIDARNIPRRELTLHVGAGTFAPVKTHDIGSHEMHSEFIAVNRQLIEELAHTDRRIIAVGTTSVRTLESLYHLGCMAHQGLPIDLLEQWYPYTPDHPRLTLRQAFEALLKGFEGDTLYAQTRLMIAPGYQYRVVQGMVTNFHQPRSTLLLLVSAFLGTRDWHQAYNYALNNDYRFLSYGDACLFL